MKMLMGQPSDSSVAKRVECGAFTATFEREVYRRTNEYFRPGEKRC